MPRDMGVGDAALPAQLLHSRTWLLLWLFPIASLCLALLLGRQGARYSPDASWYRLLALGRHGAVPTPFSARILGPAAARWLGRGSGVDRGFLLLGILSLIALLVLIFRLLRFAESMRFGLRSTALYAAIFLMPFWVDIFHDYYLPDLLHATLLAALLLCLASGRMALAMILIFPAYLARESTSMAVVCLAFAAWRRMPARAVLLGVLATVSGAFASLHYSGLGSTGIEGLRGGAYIIGKVVWNFPRNITGLSLWTNTLPVCGKPIWFTVLPQWLHLGRIHQVGVCRFSLWGPSRLLLAWFGIFGVGPAITIAFLRGLISSATHSRASWLSPGSAPEGEAAKRSGGGEIVFRFCVLYGIISLLLAPALGASVDRLVAYGWPLYFVALPWFLAAHPATVRRHGLWILAAHLLACWTAWRGFRLQSVSGYVLAGASVVALNVAVYFLVDR